jgi:ubiquinone/menaquinone biosynthesis C-methylase UbiE
MADALADAYSRTGAAWQAGPGLVYDRLADVVVAQVPFALDASLVLDVGAGTGAASRAIGRAGGTAIAVDIAVGMLAADRSRRPPAAVADAAALPFRGCAFDAVVAAFSLNHLEDPVPALREAAAILRPGGALVASAYAADDDHPVKRAADAAAREFGWTTPDWYAGLRERAMPQLSTTERAQAAVRAPA